MAMGKGIGNLRRKVLSSFTIYVNIVIVDLMQVEVAVQTRYLDHHVDGAYWKKGEEDVLRQWSLIDI